jgi:hypothetical protein
MFSVFYINEFPLIYPIRYPLCPAPDVLPMRSVQGIKSGPRSCWSRKMAGQRTADRSGDGWSGSSGEDWSSAGACRRVIRRPEKPQATGWAGWAGFYVPVGKWEGRFRCNVLYVICYMLYVICYTFLASAFVVSGVWSRRSALTEITYNI